MRRALSLALALGLLVGGAAACSDDDDGGAGTGGGDQATTTDGGSGGGEAGDAEASDDPVVAANDAVIQEYCDAKDADAEAQAAYAANPGDKALEEAAIASSGRSGEASEAVAPVVESFTPEQQAQFEACSG